MYFIHGPPVFSILGHKKAFCNYNTNSHGWRTPEQFNPGFVCARIEKRLDSTTFSAAMVLECNRFGMKPVCEHPSYCRNDAKALYIGQSSHITNWRYRENQVSDLPCSIRREGG